jgi:hypothetical protein
MSVRSGALLFGGVADASYSLDLIEVLFEGSSNTNPTGTGALMEEHSSRRSISKGCTCFEYYDLDVDWSYISAGKGVSSDSSRVVG